MDVFLIRHTVPAVEAGVCYGHLDVDVAPSFEVEADAILRTCRAENIGTGAVIIASPLKRCRVLAEFLAEQLKLPITFDPRLRELDFGAWEGERWEEIDRAKSNFWTADVWNRAPPDGETCAELNCRVLAVLNELCASETAAAATTDKAAHQRVIMVSHAGPLRALVAHALKLDAKNFPPFNVDIGRISKISRANAMNSETEVRWTLQFLNR